MNDLTNEQIERVTSELGIDPVYAQILIRQYLRENLKANYKINPSLYSWSYPYGQGCEKVDEMSIENLKLSLCSCMDLILGVQSGEVSARDIDDWVDSKYPGPKYVPNVEQKAIVSPTPVTPLNLTVLSDHAESRAGWQDNVMESYSKRE